MLAVYYIMHSFDPFPKSVLAFRLQLPSGAEFLWINLAFIHGTDFITETSVARTAAQGEYCPTEKMGGLAIVPLEA